VFAETKRERGTKLLAEASRREHASRGMRVPLQVAPGLAKHSKRVARESRAPRAVATSARAVREMRFSAVGASSPLIDRSISKIAINRDYSSLKSQRAGSHARDKMLRCDATS